MESSSVNSMCRCCATEGASKDIKTSYQWMGDEEVYGDMLRECFDVTLSSLEQGGICEVCITQLRNASNFKKQVLRTEIQFKKHLQSKGFKDALVKEEMSGLEDNDSDEMDNIDDEDYVPEFDVVPIKTESETDDRPKKRSSKTPSTRAKKTKSSDPTTVKSERRSSKIRKRAVKEENDDDITLNNLVYIEKHLPEMQKQWHNLSTLLECSNATPFKDRNDAGYVCAYCFKTYPGADILRAHTHGEHDKEKPFYKPGKGVANFVAFLDIVDLKCTLCDQPMDCLKTLSEHLVAVHNKKYYLDVTDYFQQYKLTNEQQIDCCICGEVFNNMKFLMQHMNNHYRNFICTTCGAGFVNSFRLSRHEVTHLKKPSYPCLQCGQVFAAESKKKAHVNTVHKGIVGDSVCQICKARFKNYYQKTRHMVQIHNAEAIKCDFCDRKFHLKSNLMLHMRNVHLKERPYECSVCSMGFFIKQDMLGHYLATHTNERKFKCEICGKGYATQNSKRKHLKKNHGISKNSVI